MARRPRRVRLRPLRDHETRTGEHLTDGCFSPRRESLGLLGTEIQQIGDLGGGRPSREGTAHDGVSGRAARLLFLRIVGHPAADVDPPRVAASRIRLRCVDRQVVAVGAVRLIKDRKILGLELGLTTSVPRESVGQQPQVGHHRLTLPLGDRVPRALEHPAPLAASILAVPAVLTSSAVVATPIALSALAAHARSRPLLAVCAATFAGCYMLPWPTPQIRRRRGCFGRAGPGLRVGPDRRPGPARPTRPGPPRPRRPAGGDHRSTPARSSSSPRRASWPHNAPNPPARCTTSSPTRSP